MQMAGNDHKQIPTTLYGDPYLSSSHHREASHDSGLGATTVPYPSDVGMMDFDEGMDTSGSVQGPLQKTGGHPGMRGPPNRSLDYLPSTDVDVGIPDHHPGMETDQSLQAMGGDIFDNLGWV